MSEFSIWTFSGWCSISLKSAGCFKCYPFFLLALLYWSCTALRRCALLFLDDCEMLLCRLLREFCPDKSLAPCMADLDSPANAGNFVTEPES